MMWEGVKNELCGGQFEDPRLRRSIRPSTERPREQPIDRPPDHPIQPGVSSRHAAKFNLVMSLGKEGLMSRREDVSRFTARSPNRTDKEGSSSLLWCKELDVTRMD
jgi:hypothetical protein